MTPEEPAAARPHMPGYGIAPADAGPGVLPWRWATERLGQARNYWVATTRPDGRPHTMPVWGVWLDDRFYFSSGAASRKARNLAEHAACVVGMEVGADALVVEGTAALVTDAALRARVLAAYGAKYAWDTAEFTEPLYAVTPTVVFGFPTDGDAFTTGTTRWTFGGG
jgi:nitroimidazol reductase NimA-like FMN-containing flavoprotein (pyridoxamine 5'-phosphate oxidase superfamily)